MTINIIYHKDYNSQAYSLKAAIIERWSDMSVNMIAINDQLGGAKYQVQMERDIVSRSDSPVNNTTVINLIEERL